MRYGARHLLFGHKVRVTRRHQTRGRASTGSHPPISTAKHEFSTKVFVGLIVLLLLCALMKWAGLTGPSDQDRWCAAHQDEINAWEALGATPGQACGMLWDETSMDRAIQGALGT